MRALVVGGTGVLGRQLVPRLRRRGHDVVVMSPGRRASPPPAGVGWVRGSLLAPDATARLGEVLPGRDVVINIATAIPPEPAGPGAWEVNTQLRRAGTRVLTQASRAAGVPRLVQMSITMAYHDGGEEWLDEASAFDPSPARAAIVAPVAAMEDTVRALPPDEIAWTILRGGRFVGPGTVQDAQCRGLRAGTLSVPVDGQAFVSMVHVGDYAAAVVAAAEAGLAGAVLNVSDAPVRVGAYLDQLADLIGAPRPRRAPEQVPDLPSHRVDSGAARRLLGWRPVATIWPPVRW
jgi:nucleoside-diphosphate-sugar epimerase